MNELTLYELTFVFLGTAAILLIVFGTLGTVSDIVERIWWKE